MPSNPQVLPDGDQHHVNRLSEGRPAPPGDDAVEWDLDIRNLSRAVVDGGLDARWELGAAIGRALVGGLKR